MGKDGKTMNFDMFSLKDKIALVTGGSRGLGQAMAIGLAEAGANVVITSRKMSSLRETTNLIDKVGITPQLMELDVEDVPSMQFKIAELVQSRGCIDVLVNNAGYEEVCSSLEIEEDLWDKINRTNLKGAFFCAQEVARSMVSNGGGAIINLCSLTSYVGVPTAVPYTSTKSGLLGMTRALATEWAKHNIRVNGIAPGYFRTELTDEFYKDEGWRKKMLASIPLGAFGDASDLKGIAVFLASDSSKYITGQCLTIDGGFLASI